MAFDNTSELGAAVHVYADGSYRYDPTVSDILNALPAGTPAFDSFTYTISDGHGGTDSATVRITVSGRNDDPECTDDTTETQEDTPIPINLLANDRDPDHDPLAVIQITSPSNGSVSDDGNGMVTYRPRLNFFGTDTFTYTISDGKGGTDTAQVTVTVSAENDPPQARDDTAATRADQPVSIRVLDNDRDADSDRLSVTVVTQPSHGSAVANPDGTVTYTPGRVFFPSDSFQYGVDDGAGGVDTATVTVQVTATCSGNVSVKVKGRRLIVRGNDLDNCLVVEAAAGGSSRFRVTGLYGSKVNGQTNPVEFDGATKGIRIDTDAGDDTIELDGTARRLAVPGSLEIRTSSGDDTVRISATTVQGRTQIKTAAGTDKVAVLDAVLSKGLYIDTGLDDDEVTLEDVVVARSVRRTSHGKAALAIDTQGGHDNFRMTGSRAMGPVVLTTGLGNDLVAVDDTHFHDRVSLETGSDGDKLRVERDGGPNGSPTVFDSDVLVRTSSGDDSIEIGRSGEPWNRAKFVDAVLLDGGPGLDDIDAGLRDTPNHNGNSFAVDPKVRGIERYVS